MKTKIYSVGTVCAAIFALCMPVSAQTTPTTATSPAASPQGTASPTASPAAKAMRPIPFRGTVSAVDQNAKTFTITGKQASRSFKITESTNITKAGNPATMTDIAQNEQVRGSYLKLEDGTLEVKTVKIGPPTAGEKKAKKSKKGAAAAEGSPAASPEASPKP